MQNIVLLSHAPALLYAHRHLYHAFRPCNLAVYTRELCTPLVVGSALLVLPIARLSTSWKYLTYEHLRIRFVLVFAPSPFSVLALSIPTTSATPSEPKLITCYTYRLNSTTTTRGAPPHVIASRILGAPSYSLRTPKLGCV